MKINIIATIIFLSSSLGWAQSYTDKALLFERKMKIDWEECKKKWQTNNVTSFEGFYSYGGGCTVSVTGTSPEPFGTGSHFKYEIQGGKHGSMRTSINVDANPDGYSIYYSYTFEATPTQVVLPTFEEAYADIKSRFNLGDEIIAFGKQDGDRYKIIDYRYKIKE
ncbi:MAG: hypothetical protein V4596_03550 [Bdellovibrionota bacterium]